jgi:thiamine-monophosphate kinase
MAAERPAPEPLPEDVLIADLFAPLAGEGAFGLKDDAARLSPPPGRDLVVTADMLVAGVHCFADDPADAIAKKALRVNLSDLAAKGAVPLGFLVALALPRGTPRVWLEDFARGLGQDVDRFGCPLIGGDTVSTPGPLTVSITAIGHVGAGRMPTRLDARQGDAVVVTGTIGDAALGLVARSDPARAAGWDLTEAERSHLADRYLLPRPRVALAGAVSRHARAAMDVSDGLVGDLARLARASGLAARIEAGAVPLSAAARRAAQRDSRSLEVVLTGGDDYEILATMPPGNVAPFIAAAAAAGIGATVIGAMSEGAAGAVEVLHDGRPLVLERTAYSHL